MSEIPDNVKKWNAEHPTPEMIKAECERLKTENARLTTELDAWQRTCGTRQNHIEDVEKLKAELALKDAMLSMQVDDTALIEANVKLRIENDRLRLLAG